MLRDKISKVFDGAVLTIGTAIQVTKFPDGDEYTKVVYNALVASVEDEKLYVSYVEQVGDGAGVTKRDVITVSEVMQGIVVIQYLYVK